MSPAPAPLGVPAHALTAWRQLCEALDGNAYPVPCQGTRSDAWQESSPTATTFATRACLDCPVMVACGRYAITAREQSGVWGGMTVTERQRRSAGAR